MYAGTTTVALGRISSLALRAFHFLPVVTLDVDYWYFVVGALSFSSEMLGRP